MFDKLRAVDQFGFRLPHHDLDGDGADLTETFRDLAGSTIVMRALDNELAGLTTAESAEIIGRDDRAVRDLCANGELQAYRYPARWRVDRRDLERYLKVRASDDKE